MKIAPFLAASALAAGIVFAGYYSISAQPVVSAETKPAEGAPAAEVQPVVEAMDITIGALKENPAAYEGKTLRVKGIYAGECADCQSFYFKDGVNTVETTIPKGFSPNSVELGSKLEVIGKPLLKNTAEAEKPYVKLEAERVTQIKE